MNTETDGGELGSQPQVTGYPQDVAKSQGTEKKIDSK